MKKYAHTFVYGFAIFSMFFGSGNLVFPLQIGQQAGDAWFLGFLGLLITGILLPFLGLFVIKLHRGSYTDFFNEAGPIARFALPLFILSLLGSFGVVPRCITVAHGGLEYIFPELPLWLFSLLFSGACFLICIKEHFMISVLGKWMTPILLVCLALLIGLGITANPHDGGSSLPSFSAFQNGFLTGYFTMDLFAAFFFSALIFNQIQAKLKVTHDREVLKAALIPSLIGSCLLALIYLGFVFLGARYQSIAMDISPEHILPAIASHLMGKHAGLFISIIVIFSCITTAVALNNIYAHYLCTLFNVKKDRFLAVLFLTTFLSFIFSLIDFQGIAAILTPILEVTYPSIIMLTLLSITVKGHKKMKTIGFYSVLALSLLWRLF